MDDVATAETKVRYNRIAAVYDLQEVLLERLVFRSRREELWS